MLAATLKPPPKQAILITNNWKLFNCWFWNISRYFAIPANEINESIETNRMRLVKRLILKTSLIILIGLKPISKSEYPNTYSWGWKNNPWPLRIRLKPKSHHWLEMNTTNLPSPSSPNPNLNLSIRISRKKTRYPSNQKRNPRNDNDFRIFMNLFETQFLKL